MATNLSTSTFIHQLPKLPEIEKAGCRYVFDYGGSVIKLLFTADHQDLSRYNVDIQHDGKSFVASFAHDDREDMFRFIDENQLNDKPDQVLHVTGIGGKLYTSEISQRLKTELKVHDEVDCYSNALSYLLNHHTFDELFWPLEEEGFEIALRITDGFLNMTKKVNEENMLESKWSSDSGKFSLKSTTEGSLSERYESYYDKSAPNFPCLVVICGSGNLIVKMETNTSKAELVQYTGRAGRTILGLGSLLTGAKSFDELVNLASKGNSLHVDTHLKDIKGGNADDWYGLFPDEGLSFCFGKANKKTTGAAHYENVSTWSLSGSDWHLDVCPQGIDSDNEYPRFILLATPYIWCPLIWYYASKTRQLPVDSKSHRDM